MRERVRRPAANRKNALGDKGEVECRLLLNDFIIKALYALLSLTTCWYYLQAQEDRVLTLETFEVFDSIQSDKRILMSFSFDSIQYGLNAGNDAGEFLQNSTGIYVKDHGPGSLSTLSYRGGSAFHTRIFWEGLSIDNRMLGQSDLSLYPSSSFNHIEFLKSGNSLLIGNGGISGILNYSMNSDFWTGLAIKLGQYTGSFDRKGLDYNVKLASNKFKLEMTYLYDEALNNFQYDDYIRLEEETERENAATKRIQFMPKLSYRVKDNSIISVSYWLTSADRQIPSTIGTPHNDAKQRDESHRLLFDWTTSWNKSKLRFTSALMEDDMTYENAFLSGPSLNNVRSSKSLVNHSYRFSDRWSSDVQIKLDYYEVQSNNYESVVYDQNAGAMAKINYDMDRYFAHLMMRYEYWNEQDQAGMPGLSAGWKPVKNKNHLVFANAAYNVRFPTFNDQYWSGSGNPDLKNEHARTIDLGLEYVFVDKKFWSTVFKATAFYNDIDQMIVWQPQASGIWQPVNVNHAINQGFEANLDVNYGKEKFNARLIANYAFTKSNVNPEGESETYQQIYVPLHKANAMLYLDYEGLYASYNQVFTGYVYTSNDNSDFLESSWPVNLSLGKKFKALKSQFDVRLDVKNAFDQTYQYVQHMPMPMRHYLINLTYYINK